MAKKKEIICAVYKILSYRSIKEIELQEGLMQGRKSMDGF
jgi:hypothetical protein